MSCPSCRLGGLLLAAALLLAALAELPAERIEACFDFAEESFGLTLR